MMPDKIRGFHQLKVLTVSKKSFTPPVNRQGFRVL